MGSLTSAPSSNREGPETMNRGCVHSRSKEAANPFPIILVGLMNEPLILIQFRNQL